MSTYEYPAKPTLAEVATLLRARTLDQYGNEVGNFTADTRPTATQAQQIIDSAYNLVKIRIGKIDDFHEDVIEQAREVTMLLAARLIETVYYPEQAAQEQSAASLYAAMYEESIAALESSVRDARATTTTGFITSVPLKGITSGQDWPINWEQMNLDEPWE